jgi:hypothetical protein
MRAALAFKGWVFPSSLLLTVKGSAPAVWFRLAGFFSYHYCWEFKMVALFFSCQDHLDICAIVKTDELR